MVMTSELIRLSNYSIQAMGDGYGLRDFDLSVSRGDAFAIKTDSTDDAYILLRGIATLTPPEKGVLSYKGEELDFSDYRSLLFYKRRVGYIASDATLLANRTAYDNLMIMRYYYEDSLSIKMGPETRALCGIFGLERLLELQPHHLDPEEKRLFIIVREISKDPEILLIERPRDFLRPNSIENLKRVLRGVVTRGIALVFFSMDKGFMEEFSQGEIAINKGRLTVSRFH